MLTTVMKLTKKNEYPYLTFEMFGADEELSLVQDVPIMVQTKKRLLDVQEPPLDPPKVKIYMPDLKKLKSVLDKMKNFSDQILIDTSSHGRVK